MKKIFKTVFLSLLIISCSSDLDINTDPNTPQDIDKGFALTAAEGSIATVLGGYLANVGGFFAQYHTQSPGASQYLDLDEYSINTDHANRAWDELYAGALNDLNFVKQRSDQEGDTGTFLIATLLESYTYQLLTDLFGAIPYSQAIQGVENLTPEPDSGEDVYMGILAAIDAALDKYESDPVASTVGLQDAIFEADIDNWIKFANTLKLKIYMRMAYTSQANSSAVLVLLNEDNFLTEDAAFNLYSDKQEANKNNPFYDVQIDRLGDINNIASNSLLEFYNENSDPRIESVYRPSSTGVYRGLDQGDRGSFSNTTASAYSRPNVLPDTPVYFMTVAESHFLRAEALIRYAGGTGAKAEYDAGIINSFLLYGLTEADAQSFITGGGAYEFMATGDVEEDIRQVMVQKWASLAYVNNIEAYFEVMRTKYPEIVTDGNQDYSEGNLIVSVISTLPGDATPTTLFYPDNEVDRNPNLSQKPSLLVPIWWDQK